MRKFSQVLFPLLLLAGLSAGMLCACAPTAEPGADASSKPLSSLENGSSPAGAGSPSSRSSSLKNAAGPEGSGPVDASGPASSLPLDWEEALFPEARALTDHLVRLVFTRAHIEKAQPLGDDDIFRFMLSLLARDESDLTAFYPDCVSLEEDGTAVFPLGPVQEMAGRVFGKDGWFFADSSYDEQQNVYLVPTGFGFLCVYSYEDLLLSRDARTNTVTADFSLIDSPDFPGDQRYGSYRITYEVVSKDGQTFLRYQGLQKIGDEASSQAKSE